jgi:hypothetical protein
MRTVLLSACLVVAVPGAMSARPRQAAPPTAITIDVAVTDRNGRPVPGLAASDFSVELDGGARRILAAAYLPGGAPMAGGVGPVFDAVTPAVPIYRLVVEPPEGTLPGTEFAVAIAVARAGVKTQTDPRAVAKASTAMPSRDERLSRAIATGGPERGLPILFGWTLRRAADPAHVTVDVQLEIPASAKPPLTALLGVVDTQGAIRSASRPIEAAADGTYRIDFSLPLAPGSYKLRFAAADAAGTIGAVEALVNAQLMAMGPLRASGLLRWTAGTDAQPRPLILEHLPPAVSTIGATLELYTAPDTAPPPDLLVKIGFGPGGSPAASIERIVTPEARDGVLIAEAEFPLERIASGPYTIRAVVLSGAAVLGSASATVIKR